MGTGMMSDDLSLLIGEIRGAQKAIEKRLDTQDAASTRAEDKREADKQAAIKAREEKDGRDEARFGALSEKMTNTGGRVSILEKTYDEEVKPLVGWFRDEGSKIPGRVSVLEQEATARAAEKVQAATMRAGQDGEKRGFLRTWGVLVVIVTGTAGVLGWLGADRLSALLFSIAVRLGHG
jgi:hypothetical protein